MVIANVRNVMIYFLSTFSSVANAILWLAGNIALIGSEVTVARYAEPA
jgi:hypothetical protein